MEGRELGRLTAGDVWESTWSVEAIERVLMDLDLDSAEGRGNPTRRRRSDKWTELMDK